MTKKVVVPKRNTYRHGDLYRALLEAGTQMARVGGPTAVVLREVTRPVSYTHLTLPTIRLV